MAVWPHFTDVGRDSVGFDVIVRQIVMLAIAIAVGFAAVKTRYLEADIRSALSRVIVRITLPCLIVASLTGTELSAQLLQNALIVYGVALAGMALLYGINYAVGKLLGLVGPTHTIHALASSFGNVSFLGYPLLLALFGETGLFYGVVFTFANDTLLWTFGVFVLSRDSGMRGKKALKNLINPSTVSFALAILMLVLRLRFPPVIHETLQGIGDLTTYLSMLFIGMTLATIPLRNIYRKYGIYVSVAIKMLLAPIGLILLLGLTGLDETAAAVIVLELAMPAPTMVSILAHEYHSDTQYAAEFMFVTTIASLATLPLCYYLFTLWF